MRKRLSVLLLGVILFICLLAVSALADGTDTYCMPVNGTETLDLSNKDIGYTFTVYDDGGDSAQYSDGCNGTLLITAPSNCFLSVSGSGNTESCDKLSLYDGNTTTILYGERGGEIVVDGIRTTGNVLKIVFYSDGSINYDGFALTVTLLDRSSFAGVTYVYDGTEKINMVEKGTGITLSTFASLFTLPERYHFDHWQSGGTSYAEGDAFTVNADVTFTAVIAEDPVILHGEAGTAYANYPNYALLPKQASVTADLSSWQAGDLLWVFDNGGVNGYYANGCDASMTVIAPEGLRICVRSDVTTEASRDYLRVYDGATTNAELLGTYSGTTTITPLYSSGNTVTVFFHSDYSDNRRGIDMKIILFESSSLHTLSFDAGDGSGTMDSISRLPGDQIYLPACGFTCPDRTEFDYYTDGTNKYYSGKSYTFGNTDVTLTAVYAETVVFTYENGLENPITKVYRKGISPVLMPYISTLDKMFTKTPYRKQFRAWLINGEEYAPGDHYLAGADTTLTAVFNELPILNDDGQGGKYILMPDWENVAFSLADQSNGFTIHFYDNGGPNDYYTNNCNGSMTLTAPDNYRFSVSGTGSTESGCDILSVYDSDGTTLLGSYSGRFTVDRFTTGGNTLKISFGSDSSSYSSGFDLTVRIYDPATERTLSFAPGEGGSGTMEDFSFLAGIPFEMPDCGFTAPSSILFAGWSDGSTIWQAGETVTFTESKQLTATWAESCGITYTYNNSTNVVRKPKGSTVTLAAFTDYYTLPAKMQFAGWMEHYSGTVYQAGDAYVLNEATVFDAVVEPIPVVVQDTDGTWYALMPYDSSSWLSSERADLSGKSAGFSFHVYDEGGRNGDYSIDYSSVLTIVAPEDCVVKVSGSGTTESSYGTIYDYLTFYDGQTNQSLVIGAAKYGGNSFIVPELASTGRYLTIGFTSDSSNVSSGFDLLVTLAKAVPQVTVTLDGNGAALQDGMESTYTFDQGEEVPLPPGRMVFVTPAGKVFGGWLMNGTIYDAGTVLTAEEDVTLTAVWNDATLPWDVMAGRLNAASGTNLGTIVLTEDLVAGANSEPLVLPAGVTATIDLAGHTINGSAFATTPDSFMLDIRGTLTLIDTAGGGRITGGPVQALGTNALTAPETVLTGYTAAVEVNYRSDDVWHRYACVWYPSTEDALQMAWGIGEMYESALPAHDTSEAFVVLLADAAIPANQAWTVNTGDTWISLDLNGHTFDVQGTLNGSAQIYVDSSVPGVFRSGGTIGVRLCPLSADTYYITGGEVNDVIIAAQGSFTISGGTFNDEFNLYDGACTVTGGMFMGEFYVYGGTCSISGGSFHACYITIENSRGNPAVQLYGSTEIAGVWLDVDTDKNSADMRLTVSGNAHVAEISFETSGNGSGTKPAVILNGGYFGQDPRTLAAVNADAFTFTLAGTPEAYSSQQDWDADSTIYLWRICAVEPTETFDFILPAGLNTLYENAFDGIAAEYIYVPDGCTAIPAGAFANCPNLKQIRLPKDCTFTGNPFSGSTLLEAIIAPDNGLTKTWAEANNITFFAETTGP